MGMDVYGKAATSEVGKYFRRSVWSWRPLADFILANAAEEAAACTYWHSNDADGLDAEGSKRLAARLRHSLESGEAADWVKLRDAGLNAMPRERCRYCAGSGVRRDPVGLNLKMPERVCEGIDHPRRGLLGRCNGCDGVGTCEPIDKSYSLEVNDVREFADFLEACGGFEIC